MIVSLFEYYFSRLIYAGRILIINKERMLELKQVSEFKVHGDLSTIIDCRTGIILDSN